MIDDTSDHKKSVLLAKVMGQTICFSIVEGITNKYKITISGPLFEHSWMADRHKSIPWEQISTNTRQEIINNPYILQACLDANTPDLYHPANMSLAWKVHEWAMVTENLPNGQKYWDWWHTDFPWEFGAYHQTVMLDKILSLAIEAGRVEV